MLVDTAMPTDSHSFNPNMSVPISASQTSINDAWPFSVTATSVVSSSFLNNGKIHIGLNGPSRPILLLPVSFCSYYSYVNIHISAVISATVKSNLKTPQQRRTHNLQLTNIITIPQLSN